MTQFCEHRPLIELAKSFHHMGYADGDSGYLTRDISYAEADTIRTLLTNAGILRGESVGDPADGPTPDV